MGNRPDIVDAHTIHWHGFPNQIPYFDGVPNDSLSVPIGANLVYRYLPYRGMAGTYMYHCHVSDAEHVQMGLQGVVFIRPYQNYGIAPDGSPIQKARAGAANPADPSLVGAPLGYVFNDGINPYGTGYVAGKQYANGSTAYDREFAFILDELDPRIHSDDAHFQDQDFTQYSPRFGIMNGRAWPDTIAGNWDVTTADWTGPSRADFRYNIATVDQVLTAGDLADIAADPTLLSDQVRAQKSKSALKIDPKAFVTSQQRLGSQPFSSLIQANAGETIVLRFSNLGYAEHSMELAGLPFRLIGMDAKNLLADRDGYEENPNPSLNNSANSPLTQKRADMSSNTYRTSINVAESRDLLVQIPHEAFDPTGKPLVFEFFDRNDLFTKNAVDGQPVVGGMRTQLHVFPPPSYLSGQYSLPPQQYPQQVVIPTTRGDYYK
jgi:hypothetical protein